MATPEQKYRVIEKLDSGGMAEIFRGEVETIHGFKKQVAIKRVLPNLCRNEKFISMFLDEARLSLFLNHANIVQVFDVGRADESYFIVMEYVDGLNLRTLRESLGRQQRRLDISQALFLIVEICRGLGYAHDRKNPETGEPLGIVHRDISPPNILLSKSGEVKLVDFGLAKASSQMEHTDPGMVKGKFAYLSPEAASGLEVDQRTDIFACGILLFELLTDRALFKGDNDLHTVKLVQQAEVPPLLPLNPDITPALERVVRKCLARNPEDRYQNAYDLEEAVAHHLFSRGVVVTNRDIARLVRHSHSEHTATRPPRSVASNSLGKLIEEELFRFTSIDAAGAREDPSTPGAAAQDPQLAGGGGPLDPDDFLAVEVDDPGGLQDDGDAAILTFAEPGSVQVPAISSMQELEASEGRQRQRRYTVHTPGAGGWQPGRGLVIVLAALVVALTAALVLVLATGAGRRPAAGAEGVKVERAE